MSRTTTDGLGTVLRVGDWVITRANQGGYGLGVGKIVAIGEKSISIRRFEYFYSNHGQGNLRLNTGVIRNLHSVSRASPPQAYIDIFDSIAGYGSREVTTEDVKMVRNHLHGSGCTPLPDFTK